MAIMVSVTRSAWGRMKPTMPPRMSLSMLFRLRKAPPGTTDRTKAPMAALSRMAKYVDRRVKIAVTANPGTPQKTPPAPVTITDRRL